MLKKSYVYVLLLCMLCTLFGCVKSTEQESAGEDQLKIRVVMADHTWGDTKSTQAPETGIVDTEEYTLTADVVDMARVPKVKDAPQDQGADTEGKPATRGTPMESADEIATMQLNRFETSADILPGSPVTVMHQVSAISGVYTLSPAYAWLDTKIKNTLFAFAPFPTASNGIAANANGRSLTYSTPTDNSQQPDLCCAYPKTNLVNTANSGMHLQTLTLKHKLTAVGFTMKGYDVKITNIEVSGLLTTGILDLQSGNWSALGAPGTRSVTVTGETPRHTHRSGWANITTAGGYLMMLPQVINDAAQVKITYVGVNGQQGGTITSKLKNLTSEWIEGQRVIYNIRLKTIPAVTTNELFIYDFRLGYSTSAPVSMDMANDDKLTFTWQESWLRVHQGAPKTNGNGTGGSPSGWQTSTGGPWNNIYFFATTTNPSTMDRTATVTVVGTKSGVRTFTVRQNKRPFLKLMTMRYNIHDYENQSFFAGAKDNFSFETNDANSVVVYPAASNWLKVSRVSGQNKIRMDYDNILNPDAHRETTFKIALVIQGVTYEEQTVVVYQKASNCYILLWNDGNFRLALQKGEISRLEQFNANYSCSPYRMDRSLTCDEALEIQAKVRNRTLINHAGFNDNYEYWSNNGLSWGRANTLVYHYNGDYDWIDIRSAIQSRYKHVRCVTTNRAKVY